MISALSDCVAPRQKHQGSSRKLSRTPAYKWILPNIWHFSNSSARLSMKYFSPPWQHLSISLHSHPVCICAENHQETICHRARLAQCQWRVFRKICCCHFPSISPLENFFWNACTMYCYGSINLHERNFHQEFLRRSNCHSRTFFAFYEMHHTHKMVCSRKLI